MTAVNVPTAHPSGPARRARIVVGAAFVLLVIVVVAALADAASEHDGISHIDPVVAQHLLAARSGPLTAVARGLTFMGGEGIVGVLALLVMIVALERRGARAVAVIAIGMAGSAALTVALKLAVGRARPGAIYRFGPVDGSYSFPSGHTLNSAVLLGLVVMVLVPLLRAAPLRIMVTTLAVVAAVGIGASRLYLGYHWTTDVLAAWLVAAGWLTILSLFAPTAHSVPARNRSAENNR